MEGWPSSWNAPKLLDPSRVSKPSKQVGAPLIFYSDPISPRCSWLPPASLLWYLKLLALDPPQCSQTPSAPQSVCLTAARHRVTTLPKRAPYLSLSQTLPTLPEDHRGARAALPGDGPHAHAEEHPNLCDTQAVCHPLPAMGMCCGGPASHVGSHSPVGAHETDSMAVLYNKVLFFSFLLTKNIEVVHCHQSGRFPFGSK